MEHIKEDTKRTFITACRKVSQYNLLKCSSGNMSWRVEEDVMLITANRSWMSEITEDQLAAVSLIDGRTLGNMKPSIESIFHAGILRKRRDMNVVLHFQSPHATAMCCGDISDINFNILPEVPFYMGDPVMVPFLQPGSPALAEAVIQAGAEHEMILLKNHGLVTMGEDFNQTIQKAVFFELVCGILLQRRNDVDALPEDDSAKLREAAAMKKGGA